MDWVRILAYITGTVDQELLLRNGQIDYSSSGAGTANHLAVELFNMTAGIKMNHIPYKGGGPAIIDLLGGQVQLHMNSPVNLIPYGQKT